jgi:alpha-L-fucosidase
MNIPNYLQEYQEGYRRNPREANAAWFKDAKYGLFLHYGLYSLVENSEHVHIQEWAQLNERIPVAEYAKLKDRFTADQFDADAIVRMAMECGMKYVNITTRHHDSFCLWPTQYTDFHSVNSPAKRDLLAELAQACEKYGLGLFLYYSHGRDWKHPHAPNNDTWGGSARPDYDPPEPSYKYGEDHDLNQYVQFMKDQITELLTLYPTVAGIWLDGIAVPLSGDVAAFQCQALYDHIRSIHPHALISYKQGLLGTEDFFAPEHHIPKGATDEASKRKLGKIHDQPEKKIEICTTLIHEPPSWGYLPNAKHKNEEQVWAKLEEAVAMNANLLLNTGPMPDGAIDPVDEATLRVVGARIKREGFPRRN